MHEITIAMQVLAQVEALVEREHLVRIEELEIVCGAMRQVVPEALETAYAVVSAGTVAEGARVVVREEPLRARCRACGCEFSPGIDDFRCASCGQADVEFLAGDDIVLKTVVAEREEAAKDGIRS